MNTAPTQNWQSIIELVSELKRCDDSGITTAAVAMAFICIDALANLSRPTDKPKVTRSDFKEWVNTFLKGHQDQPYQYRGKDVYAARCALLHQYGLEADIHKEDPDTIKFGYHDGGMHFYNPNINKTLVLIGTKSFVNDVAHAVESFLKECQIDPSLRLRVESRLPKLLQNFPLPKEDSQDENL